MVRNATRPPCWGPSPSLQQGVVLGAEHRPSWRAACPFKNAGGGLSVRTRRALQLAAALCAAQRGPPQSITGFTSTFSRALPCGSTTLRRQAYPPFAPGSAGTVVLLATEKSIRSSPTPTAGAPPPIGSARCRSLSLSRRARPHGW